MRSVKAVKKHSKGNSMTGRKRPNPRRRSQQAKKRAPLDGQILIDAWNYKKHARESLTNLAAVAASNKDRDVEMELPDESAHDLRAKKSRPVISKKGLGKKKKGADFTIDDVGQMLRASTLDETSYLPPAEVNKKGGKKGRRAKRRDRKLLANTLDEAMDTSGDARAP